MNIENAILNLCSMDESIRTQAIEQSLAFQTTQSFCLETFVKLSYKDSSPQFRYFAYNSLTMFIKNSWNVISSQMKESLAALFPFHCENDVEDPAYFQIVSRCAAVYLAYLGSEEITSLFVDAYCPNHRKYFASFITSYLIFLFEDTFPADRALAITEFISENILKFTKIMLFGPFITMTQQSPDFDLFADCIAAIHEHSPLLIQLLIRDPDADFFYSHLAQYVWEPSEQGSFLTIFEILFENIYFLPGTIQSLISSLHQSLPAKYAPLFSFNPIPESQISHCYFLFNSLLVRIPLIFNILSTTDIKMHGPFLEACVVLFRSSSPSILLEISNQFFTYLKSLSATAIPVFFEYYETHLRALLEVSLPLLQVSFGSSPCVHFDHRWTQQSCRSAIMDFTRCIIEMFDGLQMIQQLIEIIQIDGVESHSFHAIVRILINILGDPNEKMRVHICEGAFKCTIFLLSSINCYSPQLQNKICKLLMKFIPYLNFDQITLNKFYSQLLNLFLNARPAAFDPFTNYFNQFTHVFGGRIEFPVERLQQIPKGHPCYYTVITLLAKYGPVSETSQEITNALNELNWFTTSFRPNENASMRKVTTRLARQFEYLSQINPNDIGPQQSAVYNKIGELLIASNQILLNAGEDPSNGIPLGQYLTLLTQFAPAIEHFALITPQAYINLLNQLHPPSIFSQAVPQWVARIALPIVTKLFSTQAPSVLDFAARVTKKMCELVGVALDLTETTDSAGIVKKLIAYICEFSQYVSDDLATESLAVCLKYDNYKTFYAVAHAIEEKGINILCALWPQLMKRKDNQSVDRMSEVLLALYEKNGKRPSIFSGLPGISQSTLEGLNEKLPKSTAQKTRKRIIRSFIINFPL